LGDFGWRFLALDVLWAIAAGLAIGGALGALIGKLVLYLRTRHQEAVGLDEFLALGLIAIAYGVAQLSLASGFLAVFAAGRALQRIKEHSKLDNPSTPAKVTITLTTVAASVLLHGISVTPLMGLYARRKLRRRR